MVQERPWFADMANYKATGLIPEDFNYQMKKKFLWDYSLCVGWPTYLQDRSRSSLVKMCWKGRSQGHHVAMSQFTIRWPFQRSKNGSQSSSSRLLLANAFQGCIWTCPKLWKLPKDGRNLKEKWNALANYSTSWSLRLLGHWFCRTLSVTPRIPNNVNHTCKSEYYNVYGMLHFVKYLNNRVKFSINKVNIN